MTAVLLFNFSYFPMLETPRLVMRQINHRDADALVTLYTDPKVYEFLIIDPPCGNRDEAIRTIDWLNGFFHNKAGARWAITLKERPSQLIGTLGFHFYETKDRRVDIGFDLLPAYWGKGIMTEAASRLVHWCFEHLNLHRVQADCTEGNIASEKVLLKVGFKVEGVWRESVFEHGRFVNIKQFGLLRREHLAE
jgi:ribosomal-protein-alanine N-acetyltransferase